jgi:putative colanic acid biosynthesis glycosyltransferase
MQAVLISIITINYNNFCGLKNTLESVKSLNFNDFEYIVIDGNSKDGSSDLIANSKIVDKYLIERDAGIYDAMNKGAKLACGKFLYFLNSGDIVLPDVFLKLRGLNNIFDYDVIYGSTKLISSDKIDLSRKIEVIFYDIPFCHQSVLLNKDVFMEYKFSEKYKLAADYHLFLKVYLAGYSFHQTNLFFSKIDITGVSHTKQIDVILEYVYIIYDVHKFVKACFFILVFLIKKHKFIFRLLIKNVLK